jgi:hypothetical protein
MTARARRILVPAGTFVVVFAIHYVWTGLFPQRDPAQDRWVFAPVAEISWFRRYVETQSYWMGYSYAVALSFAVLALRRYQESRLCGARNLAIGGFTLSGFLAVAGCFLLGCCGSPMLAVYLSLFGASFLPFAKPLVAGITSITIIAGWFWLNRQSPARALNTTPRTDPDCHCD